MITGTRYLSPVFSFRGICMNFLAEHSKGKKLQDDALMISKEAQALAKTYPDVVNGILGTYHTEEGKFKTFDFIKNTIASLVDRSIYTYSTADGGKSFEDACINHLFKSYAGFIKDKMEVRAVATPGGTGALVSAVFATLDKGETLLIPNPCWGPYKGIAKHRDIEFMSYEMFDGDKFNITDVINKCEIVKAKQNKIVLMLNDPCHNPTGYSMTNDEMRSLIEYFNSTGVPCILIYDCAYLDMSTDSEHISREKFKIFRIANENVLICAGVSFSKTYAAYGMRLGCEVIFSKDREAAKDVYDTSCYLARNTWSNCNHAGISLVTKIDQDRDLKEQLEIELSQVQSSLKRRSEIFLNEARLVGLKHMPYRGGFFIAVPCSDKKALFEALKSDEHLFLLPVSDIIRVAICSIPAEKVKGIAGKIKKTIDKLGLTQ